MILMEVVVMMTLMIMVMIMVMMMDFASIQDLEIRDFVLIVNSENLIQKMGIKILTKFCNSQKHSIILSLGLIE